MRFKTGLRSTLTLMLPLSLFACGPEGRVGQGSDDDVALNALSMANDRIKVQTISPETVVTTPFGELPSRCVVAVAETDTVDAAAGVIRHANGEVSAEPHCEAEISALRADRARAKAGQPPADNGWIEDAERMSQNPLQALSAKWSVPSYPSRASSQLIYFFPSLEPSTGTPIIQPVLQYGSNGYFGGNYYSMSSWYVSSSAHYSPPIRVYPGDAMYGSMYGSGCGPAGNCARWTINTYDLSRGTLTRLFNSALPAHDVFRYVQSAVLEAYYVDYCDEYPASGSTYFHDVTLRRLDGTVQAVSTWDHAYRVARTCGEAISTSPTAAVLHY